MPKASKLQVKEKKKWEREKEPVETKACSLKKISRKEKKKRQDSGKVNGKGMNYA